MKKVIVTGANGFVGKYLVKELNCRGYSVLALGRKEWDIRHPACNLSYDVDIVVHCAALLMIDGHPVEEYFFTNALGTYNVLEFCRKAKAKLIYLMTHSDVNNSDYVYINESTEQKYIGSPESIAFITSKIAAMKMIEAYTTSKFVDGIILRLANIRGVGSQDTKYNCVFHQFIEKSKRGEPIELWGELKTIRDLIYVKDVVDAIIASFDAPAGLYNIGSGVGLTIEQEARAIAQVFNPPDKQTKFIYRSDIEEVRKKSCVFEIDKARREFGWYPKYNYVQGLSDMKAIMEIMEGKNES